MNFQDPQDKLIALHDTLKKLENDPDHDRPALVELKRILQERIAKMENPAPAEPENWPGPTAKAEETS